MSTIEKTAASLLGLAILAGALTWIGWGYKGHTCSGCGRAFAYWSLDQDAFCGSCRKLAERGDYPDMSHHGDHSDVRSWPIFRRLTKQPVAARGSATPTP